MTAASRMATIVNMARRMFVAASAGRRQYQQQNQRGIMRIVSGVGHKTKA